jgi:2'-hydroxyisoflavone reductase
MRTRRDFLSLGAIALAGSLASRRAVAAQAGPKRILLLGGTGFIGPHLVHAALAQGHQVAMLNRGRREPNQNAGDFAKVEALRGDRSTPDAYAALKGRTWDAVIDTATNLAWTQQGVAALRGATGRYMYVSSTGVFWPYRQLARYGDAPGGAGQSTDVPGGAGLHGRPDHLNGPPGYWSIPEDGVVALKDDPPQDPPSYGVLKALSEQAVRDGFPQAELVIRPGYIVGPGDTSDRFTYWPVRIARGGEVLVPGRKGDFVQYVDVRDLAAFMIGLIEKGTAGTFNVTGPATPQTMERFVEALRPLAPPAPPLTYTWIEDYAWLAKYPLREATKDVPGGLVEAIPWVMAEGTELGHMRIDNRKAKAAGLTYRPLLTTARDTLAWRQSGAVPQALRDKPRYVLTEEQERAILAAWKAAR